MYLKGHDAKVFLVLFTVASYQSTAKIFFDL